jgi:hypothetical protein
LLSHRVALFHRHEIYDSDDDDSVEDDIAVDDGVTEPAVKSTKRVHKKKKSRENVQEVLSEAEGEGTEWIECDNFVISKAQSTPVTSTNLPWWHLRGVSPWESYISCCILDGRSVCALPGI